MANVRILHVSRMRLDAPFSSLDPARTERALHMAKESFASLADTVRREKIDLLLLGPECLAHGYASEETVRLFCDVLSSLEPTAVMLLPGKSDAYSEHSLYAGMRFAPHVRLFSESALRKVTLKRLGVTVYGRARLQEEITPPLSAQAEEDSLVHIFFGQGDETAEELASIGADVAFLPGAENSVCEQCGVLICKTGACVRRGFDECGKGSATLLDLTVEPPSQISCDARELPLFPLHYERITVPLDGARCDADVTERLRAALDQHRFDQTTCLSVAFTGALPLDFPIYALGNAVSALCSSFFYTEMKNETEAETRTRVSEGAARRGLSLHSALIEGAEETLSGEDAEAVRAASAALEGRRIGDVLSF